jgi:hypothetical protein
LALILLVNTISTKEGKMKNIILAISVLLYAQVSLANLGLNTCDDKKRYLRDICKSQKLYNSAAHFSECANGFQYEISSESLVIESDFVTTDIQCKMVEVRNQDGIETRTSYFDKSNNKVVVYQHDNGLANAYVYGHTGYYHITQFASGDSIYNFHSFDN